MQKYRYLPVWAQLGRRRRRRNDHCGGSDRVYRHGDLCKYIAVRKIAVALCTRADSNEMGRLQLLPVPSGDRKLDQHEVCNHEWSTFVLGLGNLVSVPGSQWRSRGTLEDSSCMLVTLSKN